MEAKGWDVNLTGTRNCPKIPNNVDIIVGVVNLTLMSSSWTMSPQNSSGL